MNASRRTAVTFSLRSSTTGARDGYPNSGESTTNKHSGVSSFSATNRRNGQSRIVSVETAGEASSVLKIAFSASISVSTVSHDRFTSFSNLASTSAPQTAAKLFSSVVSRVAAVTASSGEKPNSTSTRAAVSPAPRTFRVTSNCFPCARKAGGSCESSRCTQHHSTHAETESQRFAAAAAPDSGNPNRTSSFVSAVSFDDEWS